MLIKDRLLKLITKETHHQESETLAFVGGGVKPCCSADFGGIERGEKFRSLEVEKGVLAFFSTATTSCPTSTLSPLPQGARGSA